MPGMTAKLRELFAKKIFLTMPGVYDALGARLVEAAGFEAAYVGGYISGATLAVSEPQLTMTEQVAVAEEAARSVRIPVVVDAGAGFGEPLHTMRTVREFIRAGVAGIHIEDQFHPKRASYHNNLWHVVPLKEYVDKLQFACRQRDELDRDFVIIARSDAAPVLGLEEACARVNAAAEVGADYGMVVQLRDLGDIERAPKLCKIPLIYVQARGMALPPIAPRELRRMGYVAALEALIVQQVAARAIAQMLDELRKTEEYKSLSHEEFHQTRKLIESALRLDEYYKVEAATVEVKGTHEART